MVPKPVGELPETTTLQQAWDLCEHGGWLLWLLVRWHPKDSNYHQFILRTARRALSTAGAGADPSLVQVIADKEIWYQQASSKELEALIVWPQESSLEGHVGSRFGQDAAWSRLDLRAEVLGC